MFSVDPPPADDARIPVPPPLEVATQDEPTLHIISPEKPVNDVPVYLVIGREMRSDRKPAAKHKM
jgi:hypothetical protein